MFCDHVCPVIVYGHEVLCDRQAGHTGDHSRHVSNGTLAWGAQPPATPFEPGYSFTKDA